MTVLTPASIEKDDSLSVNEKRLFGRIFAEAAGNPVGFFSTVTNREIADWLSVSKRTARRLVSALAVRGLIVREAPSTSGKRGHRRIFPSVGPVRGVSGNGS